jgi:basic amino acid/polyamine antiporter, APA family
MLAMVGPLFSMDAWNNITFAGEEVKDAEKILPRSLVLGTLTVIGLYTLANIVYLLLIPLHGTADATTVVGRGIQYATSDRVGTAAAEIIFGDIGKYLMAGAIMISTFGCLNGLILAGARVYYAMAKDNLFFQRAAVLDPKTNVPVFGLIVQGIWSAILATSGTYSDLLEYVVFAALAFYVATVAAVIVLRKTRPDAERPYKTPLYPLLPIVYLITAIAIMGGQVFTKFGNSGKGLLIILSGLPIYFIWVKLRRSQAATSA